MKIDVVTPKLNDTEGREVQTEGNISQINPNTETHNETVKNESFQTPMGGSTIESINTNTNNKSIKIPANRSTKIPAPKIATQQKRDTQLSPYCQHPKGVKAKNFQVGARLLLRKISPNDDIKQEVLRK